MSLLKTTLFINAGSSAITGLVLAVGAVPVADWLGIPTWVAVVVGIGLLGFAVSVTMTARNPRPDAVRQIIIADVAWVIGAVIVIFGFPGSMTTAGLRALGLISLAVAGFAILQTLGLRRVAVAA